MSRNLQIDHNPVAGSIAQVAHDSGQSIAETFMSADVIVIVDTSGSMGDIDRSSGKSRYVIACDELKKLQADLSGRIAVLSFSSSVVFCPGGVPVYLGMGTDMAGALTFAKVADIPPMRFIVIADGYPDNRNEALKVARTFQSRIDTIYVGPETDNNAKEFMRELARVKQGQNETAKNAMRLSETTKSLLLSKGTQ